MTPDDSKSAESPGANPDEEVRRLLGLAAAEPMTMPADVTARLDGVLAGLVADRATFEDDAGLAPVIDIDHRRTSRWPKLLVAAAAVSVLGVGLANVLNQTESSMTADFAKSAEAGDSGGAESATSQDERAADEGTEPQAPTDALDGLLDDRGVLAARRTPRLRSSTVTVDAQRIADSSLPVTQTDSRAPSGTQCRPPSISKGDVQIAVRLDGARATLVFRAKEDGRRFTEVFSCDDAESPVLTTTVDAP